MNLFTDIMKRGDEKRKARQLSLPAIHVELDDFYEGGWAYTEHDSYYFDQSTDIVAFIKMILDDLSED